MKRIYHNSLLCLGAVLLSVSLVGCAGTRYGRSTGQFIDDKAVTAKVKSELSRDSLLRGSDIKVETFRGHVQLAGYADHSVQKERAGELVRYVRGVQYFRNDIQIKESLPNSAQRSQGDGASFNEAAGASRADQNDRLDSSNQNQANQDRTRSTMRNSGNNGRRSGGWSVGLFNYDERGSIVNQNYDNIDEGHQRQLPEKRATEIPAEPAK